MKNLFARSGSIQSYLLKVFELLLAVSAVFLLPFFSFSFFQEFKGFVGCCHLGTCRFTERYM